MHHAVLVGISQCRSEIAQDPYGILDGKLTLARDALAQRLSANERHREVRFPADIARREHRDDVRMLKLRRQLNFSPETLGADPGCNFIGQNLYHDAALELLLRCQKDATHGSAAELALHGVFGKARVECRDDISHDFFGSGCVPLKVGNTGARTRSMSSRASSGSITPDAETSSSICSGRLAPTIADETPGSRSTHASAICAIVMSRRAAIGRSSCTVDRTSSRWRSSPQNLLISGLTAREFRGGGRPGRYFPVNTPCASGDQTIWPMPFAAQSGITSSSGSRHSMEYCGWLLTNRSTPDIAIAAEICSAFHSLNPM